MPLFEFECPSCSHEFEELVLSFNGTGDVSCPVCGESDVQKKISTFASKVAGGNSLSLGSSAASCNTGST
jgi:putative FmdB family regulatory protein